MVKKALFILLFTGFVFAATPEQVLVNLGGAGLVVDDMVDENSNPDISKITKSLQDNGKLQLLVDKKTKTVLNFNSNANGVLLLKSIENMISNLRYGDYQNLNFVNNENSSYSIVVNLDRIPNPGEIYKELKKSNIFINDVKKGAGSFTYFLDLSKASIYATAFGSEYKKPTKPYFINVNGKKTVSIEVQEGDTWHPSVKIFDKNLNLIDSLVQDSPQKSINFELPENAHYIQVDDGSSLENIQKGLKFNLQ
ncbi:hypothetical protein [Campylobacter geochelonis]|uniref:hypothetical protein n=1 Tax=Campylobacter geochelonis TaxID=1780362 RepID=UPI0007707C31|nr:hypothetical protein [Campylobacter geochelonis]CZE46610.1 Putative periplasmic protein [Campylobacter geochelonis]